MNGFMLNLFKNLFGGRRRRFGRFGRSNNLARTFGRHRGGFGLGSLAAIAAPFLIRKLRSRRANHYGPAY
jgi:hypothetical protein